MEGDESNEKIHESISTYARAQKAPSLLHQSAATLSQPSSYHDATRFPATVLEKDGQNLLYEIFHVAHD